MAAKLCCPAFTVYLRRRSRLRHSGDHRGLVDRVAGELVELVGEQIGWNRRIARWEGGRLAVELDADELGRRLVLEADRPFQARAKPAREQLRLRLRAGDLDPLDLADVRPERSEQRA